MTGSGGRNHRPVGGVTGGDLLPTAFAVEEVRRLAWRACCELAMHLAWPDLAEAKACLDLIPFVALDALAQLCPGVRGERLARCLGLDPLDGVDELVRRKALAGWPADTVQAVYLGVGSGR